MLCDPSLKKKHANHWGIVMGSTTLGGDTWNLLPRVGNFKRWKILCASKPYSLGNALAQSFLSM